MITIWKLKEKQDILEEKLEESLREVVNQRHDKMEHNLDSIKAEMEKVKSEINQKHVMVEYLT